MEAGDVSSNPSSDDQKSSSDYPKPDEKTSEELQNEELRSDSSIDQAGIATLPTATSTAIAESSDSEITSNTDSLLDLEPPELAKNLLEGTKKQTPQLSESYSDDLVLKWDDEDGNNSDPNKTDSTNSTDKVLQSMTNEMVAKEVTKSSSETSMSMGDLMLPATSLSQDPISKSSAINNKNLEDLTPSKAKENDDKLDSTDSFSEFDEDFAKTDKKVDNPHEGDVEMSLDDVIASLDKEINNSDEDITSTDKKNTKKVDLEENKGEVIGKSGLSSKSDSNIDITKVAQELEKNLVPIKAEVNTGSSKNPENNPNVKTLPSEDTNMKDVLATAPKEVTEKILDQQESLKLIGEPNQSSFEEMDTTPIINTDLGVENTKKNNKKSMEKYVETTVSDPEPMEVSDANPTDMRKVMDTDEPTSGMITPSYVAKTDIETTIETNLVTKDKGKEDCTISEATKVSKNDDLVAAERKLYETPSKVTTADVLESESDAKPIETKLNKEEMVTTLDNTKITGKEVIQNLEKSKESISEITENPKETDTLVDKTKQQENLSNITSIVKEATTLPIDETIKASEKTTLGTDVTTTMVEPEPMSLDVEENLVSASNNAKELKDNDQALSVDENMPKTSENINSNSNESQKPSTKNADDIENQNKTLKSVIEDTNETSIQDVSMTQVEISKEIIEKADKKNLPNTDNLVESVKNVAIPMETESEPKISETNQNNSEKLKSICVEETTDKNPSDIIEPMSVEESEEFIKNDLNSVENISTVSTPSSSNLTPKTDESQTVTEKEPVPSENIPLTSDNISKSVDDMPNFADIILKTPKQLPSFLKNNVMAVENALERFQISFQSLTSNSESIKNTKKLQRSISENILTSEIVPNAPENIVKSNENIVLSLEFESTSTEKLLSSSENVPKHAKNMQSTAENIPTSTENKVKSSENITKTDKNLPDSAETKLSSAENLPNSAENKPKSPETIPTTSENIPKSSENIPSAENTPKSPETSLPTTSEPIPTTSEKPLTSEETPSASDTIKPTSENQPSTSETIPTSSEPLPTTSETLPTTSETLPTTSETLPTTSETLPTTSESSPTIETTKTPDQMDPDASDEIPEVTDSLGLLAESCRPMDDQDLDEEPVDDDEDGEDEDDDDDDNRTPLEHSEDSNNAQSSETDQPKELIEATDSVIETEAVIDVPLKDADEKVDSNLTEEVIKLPEIATVTTIGTVEQSKDILDAESKNTEMSADNTDLLKNLLENEKSTEPTKSVEASPSKTKKLEISQPKVVMNFVDLEESSSEDDIQEINKDKTETTETNQKEEKTSMSPQKQEQVTINLPKEIDVMSTAVGSPSSIVSKEGEVEISGIPKPTVAKIARLNTDEITIKTAKDSEPNLVIPETKMVTEVMTKAQAVNELNQEIFNLDSDEDKDKEPPKTKLDLKSKEADRCINPLCDYDHGTTPKIIADSAILRFFKVKKSSKKKKEPAMVCILCANEVALRMESLVEGVKSLKPLLELDIDKSVQELVEISDSDTDSDDEGRKREVIGRDAAKFLENELENMINSTWKKYNLDERLQTAKEHIETEVDELERETKKIDDMLNECQVATDNIRRQFYSNFARRISTVKPFVIVDTPTVKYSHLVEEEDVLPAAQLNRSIKRSKSFADEPPFKRIAGTWGPLKKEESRTSPDSKDDDNTEVKVVKLSAESAPSGLPPAGELVRPPVKNGEMVLAARNLQSNWTRARVEFVLPKVSGSPFTQCRVRFEHKVKAQVKVLQCKHIAYYEPANVRLTIGTRIIALFKDPTNPQKRDVFYSGVVAEVPNPVNKYRYLVFFDDGYAQYVTHENTRVVVESSTLVWDEVGPLSREFVRNYLLAYPERPMVRLHAGQKLKTEWNGKWWLSKVIQVDASLVHVFFEADNRYEWIYRGSTRLAPLYLELQAAERHRNRALHRSTGNSKARVNMPYVEYTRTDETSKEDAERERRAQEQEEEIRRQRAVAKKSTSVPNTPMAPADTAVMSRVVYYTPKAAVKPYKMSPHSCSPKCRRSDVLPLKELRTYNPLARPLLSGWERQIVRFRFRREIMYRAPCGRRLRSMDELHQYLMIIQSEMSVDLFDFGVNTHCLAEFVLNRCLVSKKDLSHGKENVPVPCVNYYDQSLPEFCSYNTERTPTAGVPLNLDPEFLCGCDCTDDCRDKTKCACWKLTLEGARTIGMDDDVGYVYRRLQEPVPSGIYECNSRCKCKSTCLNRVAQHPLQLKLQVFKTQNRGWGIRALNDVPKGGFLCIYAGNLLTDATANLDGLNEGDEYLAELDYIEVVEQMKEGFEADIPEKDKELDRKSSSKSSSASSESDEEEEKEERARDQDGDFKPDVEPGIALFSKRLRRRKKKEGEDDPQKDKDKEKSEEDCITISDDEELREPSRFMAQAGMGANQFISKYKSVRQHFGEDEACYIMDAKVQGNIGRYLNHSCTPNVFVQNVFVDTHDPRFPWVAFFALAHVKAGTELTWNYNYDIGSVPGKVLYCYCGAPNCRGRLL